MNYYIASWTGTGSTPEDSVRPLGVDALPAGTQWQCIDFRPLNRQTVAQGWCLLATAQPIPNAGAVTGLRVIGTDLDAVMPQAAIDLVQTRFGVTLDADTTTWRKLVKHLLTRKGTDPSDPTRWNRLARTNGRNVIWFGGEKIVDDQDD